MDQFDISAQLKSLNIRPSAKLGQVFLINKAIISKQVELAKLSRSDTVLEIGPGFGFLTLELAKYAGKVIAIEYDPKLYSYLETMVPSNVELINDDALNTEFPMFNKIVANIPYQISSPLIFKLTNYEFEFAILMLQTEFAHRLVSQIGTKQYSRLTVMSNYYFSTSLLATVSKTSFYPIPKVDSTLIQLVPRLQREIPKNEKLFIQMVRILFNERRKMIKNPIINQFHKLVGAKNKLKISSQELKGMISDLPNLEQRPEQLSLEQLIQLSNELDEIISDLNINGSS